MRPGWSRTGFPASRSAPSTAALIAGNPPDRRLEALSEFWDRITDRTLWPYTPDGDIFRQSRNTCRR